MSLEIKRAAKDFQDNYLASCIEKVKDACGITFDFEIDYGSFKTKEDFTFLPNVFFDRFAEAMGNICVDDFGRDAVKSLIKKVKVVCIDDPEKKTFGVDKGTFLATGAWGQSWGYHSAQDYQTFVEQKAA